VDVQEVGLAVLGQGRLLPLLAGALRGERRRGGDGEVRARRPAAGKRWVAFSSLPLSRVRPPPLSFFALYQRTIWEAEMTRVRGVCVGVRESGVE
jgi:hypothetical protein